MSRKVFTAGSLALFIVLFGGGCASKTQQLGEIKQIAGKNEVKEQRIKATEEMSDFLSKKIADLKERGFERIDDKWKYMANNSYSFLQSMRYTLKRSGAPFVYFAKDYYDRYIEDPTFFKEDFIEFVKKSAPLASIYLDPPFSRLDPKKETVKIAYVEGIDTVDEFYENVVQSPVSIAYGKYTVKEFYEVLEKELQKSYITPSKIEEPSSSDMKKIIVVKKEETPMTLGDAIKKLQAVEVPVGIKFDLFHREYSLENGEFSYSVSPAKYDALKRVSQKNVKIGRLLKDVEFSDWFYKVSGTMSPEVSYLVAKYSLSGDIHQNELYLICDKDLKNMCKPKFEGYDDDYPSVEYLNYSKNVLFFYDENGEYKVFKNENGIIETDEYVVYLY